jgi:hypothetical protein
MLDAIHDTWLYNSILGAALHVHVRACMQESLNYMQRTERSSWADRQLYFILQLELGIMGN